MKERPLQTVAILCAQSRSVYFDLDAVEVYDAKRDARTFGGGKPVVAHPPCRAWSRHCAHQAKPEPGERELGLWCVDQVKKWGGGIGAAGRISPMDISRTARAWKSHLTDALVSNRLASVVGLLNAEGHVAPVFRSSTILCQSAVFASRRRSRPEALSSNEQKPTEQDNSGICGVACFDRAISRRQLTPNENPTFQTGEIPRPSPRAGH